ncbi:MAG: hypothetical protein R3C56_16910 [Pirellulaceae bacterium]
MSEPPIRQAIDFTQDTIVARAADYRNLVVILSLGTCGLLITTLVTWNWMLLFVFCWLLPLVHGWLWLDARRIRRWRSRIIEICDTGQLDIEVFRSTISHLKTFPNRHSAACSTYCRQTVPLLWGTRKKGLESNNQHGRRNGLIGLI